MFDYKSLVWEGITYKCTPLKATGDWAFPVGAEQQYPPERWYAATVHDLTGKLNNGYKHSGIDLNLDVSPRGDIERLLGLAIYAVSDGLVSYITDNWYDVPMIVVHSLHNGKPLYIRYAHLIPAVMLNESVKAGQKLGAFADWRGFSGGDHLHFDMAFDHFEREWLDPDIRWIDPVFILKAHLPPARVQAMIDKGN